MLPECEEFLGSFKSMIANRGRPQKVISDNGRTFTAAVHKIMRFSRVSEKTSNKLVRRIRVKIALNVVKASKLVQMKLVA